MRLALVSLVAIGLGIAAGGGLAFLSGREGPKLTTLQAERAVVLDGNYDAAHCERADGGEFSCKGLARQRVTNHLKAIATVRVYEQDGRAVIEDRGAP